jgi:hypothetical protein
MLNIVICVYTPYWKEQKLALPVVVQTKLLCLYTGSCVARFISVVLIILIYNMLLHSLYPFLYKSRYSNVQCNRLDNIKPPGFWDVNPCSPVVRPNSSYT